MKNPKKIALFDIDYTLFDTDVYIESFFPLLSKELGIGHIEEFKILAEKANSEAREIAGFFDPLVFLDILLRSAKKNTNLQKLEKLFFENEFYDESLYDDVLSVLETLSSNKNVAVGILSTGHDKHQRRKISFLKKYFKEEFIHIFPDKLKRLESVLSQYKNNDIYLIDDYLKVLETAKKLDKTIHTIWIKKERKHEGVFFDDRLEFRPDYTFANLSAILSVLR